MTTLVIGGAGFIGVRVTRRLLERGEDVVCMDIGPLRTSYPDMEDRLTYVRGDVTQFEDVLRATIEARPDRVINLSYIVGGGEVEPRKNLLINVVGMDNCFEAARLCGVGKVVYASSLATTGDQSHFGDKTVNEDDPVYGVTQYARHKQFNEFQAQLYRSNYGLDIVGIRPANVAGPDKARGSVDHVQCITLPARGLPVTLPFKTRMRTPIYVEDISEVFVRVSMAASTKYNLYNSGGTPISISDIADMVRGYLPDAQISFEDEGGFEQSSNYLIDNSRLLSEFELEYKPYPETVREIINTIRAEEGLPLV